MKESSSPDVINKCLKALQRIKTGMGLKTSWDEDGADEPEKWYQALDDLEKKIAVMKRGTLLFLFGLIGLLALLVGIFKKITHQFYADLILTIGLLAFGIFWIMTIWDVGSLIYYSIKPYKSGS